MGTLLNWAARTFLVAMVAAFVAPAPSFALMDWSKQRIVYMTNVNAPFGPVKMAVVDARDGSNYRELDDGLPVWTTKPVWAPGESAIAFQGEGIGGFNDIFKISYSDQTGASTLDNLTESGNIGEADVSYASDGQAMVYTRYIPTNGTSDIFLDRFTGADTSLARYPNISEPSLSPTADRVAYTLQRDVDGDDDRESAIYTSSVSDDGDAKPLAVSGLFDYEPSWSPTTQEVAFVSDRDGAADIYLQRVGSDGAPLGPPRQLTDNDASDRRPSWSPDGSQIVFSSDRDGNSEIYRMPADGGEGANGSNLTRLTFTNERVYDFMPAWGDISPQGGGPPPPPPDPPPPPPPPASDRSAPRSVIDKIAHVRLRKLPKLKGSAYDPEVPGEVKSGLSKAQIAISIKAKGRCWLLTDRGLKRQGERGCNAAVWLTARGTGRFSFNPSRRQQRSLKKLRRKLRRKLKLTVTVRAIDAAGNIEPTSGTNTARFTIAR